MPNALLQDKTISHKARGVLCYLLSKPDNWEVRREDLRTEKDGESAIRSALKELREAGYIQWEPVREGGRIVKWEHLVYDEKQDVENPHVVYPHVVNHPPTNNREELNTEEEQITDKDSNANALLRSAVKKPTALQWPDEHQDIFKFLTEQEILTTVDIPLDFRWWDTTSIACGGIGEDFLTAQFAKMELWLMENPNRKPTPRGAKRFIRTWLERAREHERRFANGKR